MSRFPPLEGDPQGLRCVFLLVLLQCKKKIIFLSVKVCAPTLKSIIPSPFQLQSVNVYWADNSEERHACFWQPLVDVITARERVLNIYIFENVQKAMCPTLALCQDESINKSLNEVSFLLKGEKETMSKDFLSSLFPLRFVLSELDSGKECAHSWCSFHLFNCIYGLCWLNFTVFC